MNSNDIINEIELLINQIDLDFSLNLSIDKVVENNVKSITNYILEVNNNSSQDVEDILDSIFTKIETYIKTNYTIDQYIKFLKDFKLSNQYYNIKRNIVFTDGFIAEGKTELINTLFKNKKEGSLLVPENDSLLREEDINNKTLLKDNQPLIIYLYLYKLYHACNSSFINLFVDRTIFSQLCFDKDETRYDKLIQIFSYIISKNPNDKFSILFLERKVEIDEFIKERTFEKEIYLDMNMLFEFRTSFYNKYKTLLSKYINYTI